MIDKSCVFITKAMFFESNIPKHKPVLVEGREFYSLTYRYSGKVIISTGDTTLISESDSITFMPKGVSYTTEVCEDVRMATVHFDLECENPPNEPAVIEVGDSKLRSLFKALMKSGANTSASLSGMSIFYGILAELDSLGVSSVQRTIPARIRRSRELIDERYRDPYFSVSSLADEIGVSEAYLRREFKLLYGVSPIGYLKNLRMETAKRLLLTERYPVARIAIECGYAGASYFIQDFHKAVGEAPGAYRKRLIEFS